MSVASISQLVSVEEFEQLPEPASGHYELHHGEVVLVSPPLQTNKRVERRLRLLLEGVADANGFMAETEFAYRPLPQSEVWVADVACISLARESRIEKWLEGSPELVIEVRSPSNSKDELHDRAMTTLAGHGAVEFWIVDQGAETVTVYTRTSGLHIYRAASDSGVPLPMFDDSVQLAALF